jgi:hypothetical protein
MSRNGPDRLCSRISKCTTVVEMDMARARVWFWHFHPVPMSMPSTLFVISCPRSQSLSLTHGTLAEENDAACSERASPRFLGDVALQLQPAQSSRCCSMLQFPCSQASAQHGRAPCTAHQVGGSARSSRSLLLTERTLECYTSLTMNALAIDSTGDVVHEPSGVMARLQMSASVTPPGKRKACWDLSSSLD